MQNTDDINARRRAEMFADIEAKEQKDKAGDKPAVRSHIPQRPLPKTDDTIMPARHFVKPEDTHHKATPQPARKIPDRPNFKLSVGGEEYDAAMLARSRKEEEPVEQQPTPPKAFRAPKATSAQAPAGWFRIGLPSQFIPYDFKEVFVRPLEIDDLFAIASAHKTQDFSMFLDAIDQAASVDIRDLTSADYRFILYWLRLNSYTKSPYKTEWTSRYGNHNTLTIEKTDLKIVELAMTQEEYDSFAARGITFPTVRDAETLSQVDENSIDKFMLERAQYVYTDDRSTTSMQSKLDALRAGGISMLETIREFASNIEHGVVETATVVDEHFDPVQAIEYFRNVAATLTVMAENAVGVLEGQGVAPAGAQADVARLLATGQDMLSEAAEIEKILADGGKPKPREETVPLEINALSFFPEL